MRIGFVPTMGALHAGHISLIEQAGKECDMSIASIFVNPTQFNEKADLRNYPRTVESDIEKLISAGNDILFLPDNEEIYPDGTGDKVKMNFGSLLDSMEAVHRKGHFNGVAQVVKRLLEIVNPDVLYMGQKDYQQFLIIKRLIQKYKIKTELRMCATIREPDGLAMSSRNMLLSPKERIAANSVSRVLFKARDEVGKDSLEKLKAQSIQDLTKDPLIQVEYFEIADAETLKPVKRRINGKKLTICTAIRLGSVRLIDNVIV